MGPRCLDLLQRGIPFEVPSQGRRLSRSRKLDVSLIFEFGPGEYSSKDTNNAQLQLGPCLFCPASVYKYPMAGIHDIRHILLRHDCSRIFYLSGDGQEVSRGD